ncbi:MAG: mandelate racemase/muconate lactonizing enzyme family protein [Actinomycetota bacterium]|nr:mandelate racemase/muconate lactonizing enzyme family protein [Actinomycetota bacterium]
MKIESIDVFQVELPYSGGVYRLARGREYASFDSTVVRVTCDDGTSGWGESVPFGSTYIAAHGRGVRAGIDEMAPHLLGLDPRTVDRTHEHMDGLLVGHGHAKCAVDVACWDVFGKSVGMPVCDLLGGSTGEPLGLISSIYAGSPDDMRARVAEHRQLGYIAHSVKVGDDPARDAERVASCLADRQPGEYFLVDANGSMTVETALRFLRLLPTDLDVVLEAPCSTVRETLSLRRRSDVPIVWDELATDDASVVSMIAADGADGLGLKISKSGGLTPARRQRDMAIAAGYTMSVQDTVGSDIAFAAVVHLAQTVPTRLLRCMLDVRGMVNLSTVRNPVPVVDGGVTAPREPGLGIDVDTTVLGDPVASYS